MFPKWQEGEDGEGDGKYVSLVKVSNKVGSVEIRSQRALLTPLSLSTILHASSLQDPDWAGSLTPHVRSS